MAVVWALVPMAAQSAVDFSGTWTIVQEGYGPLTDYTETWTVVQTGTQLQLDITFSGTTRSFTGTIDPDAGTFDVPMPPTASDSWPYVECPGSNHFFGTVAADGQTVSGEWIQSIIEHFPGTGCFAPLRSFEGARPGCGSGIIDPGESCDDGNAADGDCCSATCETKLPDGAACSDGSACTADDQCAAGICVSGDEACGPCEVCAGTVCVPPIDAGCQPSLAGGKSKITLVAGSTPGKDKLNWSWRSSDVVARASVPSHSAYTLCVIDRASGAPTLQIAAPVPADGTCKGKPCWKWSAASSTYRDSEATPGGLTALDLQAGDAPGRGKLGAKGKGENLGLPRGPLTPPVIVRLVRDDSLVCWESTHSSPQLNVGGRFKASSD